jgi:hypothetical protein
MAIAVVLGSLGSGATAAQVLDRPTLYRLERGTTFQRGCFPPCMCPIMEAAPVTGTFRLELVSVGDIFDYYRITRIHWKVRRHDGEILTITGSGDYYVSTIIDQQRMSVELTVGSDPPTTYESDYVPGGAAFPRIAVAISIHGGYCFDTVIDLGARPARRFHVGRNDLSWDANAESNVPSTYDVVRGDLATLLGTGGAYDVATWDCVADGVTGTEIPFTGAPDPGAGFWFLDRLEGGSYADDDAAQVGLPDGGIAMSRGACP